MVVDKMCGQPGETAAEDSEGEMYWNVENLAKFGDYSIRREGNAKEGKYFGSRNSKWMVVMALADVNLH